TRATARARTCRRPPTPTRADGVGGRAEVDGADAVVAAMAVTVGAGAAVAKVEGAAEAEEAEEAAVAGRRHAAATLGRAPAAGPTARVTWPRATRRATSRRRGSAASPSLRNLGAISGPPCQRRSRTACASSA